MCIAVDINMPVPRNLPTVALLLMALAGLMILSLSQYSPLEHDHGVPFSRVLSHSQPLSAVPVRVALAVPCWSMADDVRDTVIAAEIISSVIKGNCSASPICRGAQVQLDTVKHAARAAMYRLQTYTALMEVNLEIMRVLFQSSFELLEHRPSPGSYLCAVLKDFTNTTICDDYRDAEEAVIFHILDTFLASISNVTPCIVDARRSLQALESHTLTFGDAVSHLHYNHNISMGDDSRAQVDDLLLTIKVLVLDAHIGLHILQQRADAVRLYISTIDSGLESIAGGRKRLRLVQVAKEMQALWAHIFEA